MLKLNYFLADIFILSAEKQPIKLSWRKIEWLPKEKLTPRQREIFELNKEQNLSVAEIAEQLCIKEQVVRNQLSTALKIIRAELQQYSFILLLFLSHF